MFISLGIVDNLNAWVFTDLPFKSFMPSEKISLAGDKGKSTGQKYQWSPRIGDCNIEAWNCSYLTLRWAHFKAFLCKLYILSTLATTFGLLATLVTEKVMC